MITFDDAVIGRILKKVGETKQGERLTKNVDPGELAKKLEGAQNEWETYSAAHHASPKHVREKRAKAFRRIAKSSKHLLEEIMISRRWLSVFPSPADLDAFLVSLNRVIDVAEGAAQTYEYKAANGFRSSSKEWFVGGKLAQIYKECFGRPAGAGSGEISGRGGKDTIHGPFTRFVIAVMEEMGEDVTANIVKRALREPRRKPKQEKHPQQR
jgi:hypothetical protein